MGFSITGYMPVTGKRYKLKRLIIYMSVFLVAIVVFLLVFINRFLEPVLRDRLHTLIVQGSDSLYTYRLGNLNVSFFGGKVEVENLQIQVDSSRYRQMAGQNALPALTLELNLVRGSIRGISVLPLVFGKKIDIREIFSKDANVVLLRHVRPHDVPHNTQPLWKSIQPVIQSIAIDRIHLDGVKLLYRNADTSESIKLQFDKCIALFDDVRVDSASATDTSRIAFTKEISMQFHDLKFRTPDSSYKMKAEAISYSSRWKVFEVVDFKIQPTLKSKEDFYRAFNQQKSMQVITFDRARFTNLRLDRFINNNIIAADTLYLDRPQMDIYIDRTYPPVYESKVGKYPHQALLKAPSTIMVSGIVIRNGGVTYTEKNEKTLQEGQLTLSDLNVHIANVTNDSSLIRQNGHCVVTAQGRLLGHSPLSLNIDFNLDSADGRFVASGTVKNVSAAQLNALAVPLANTRLQSFDLHQLQFQVRGNDFDAESRVRMRYNNLYIVLQKQDEETGTLKTKKFMTKLLNKFTLYEDNPGPNGVERTAEGARRVRLSSQSFFGLLWKSIFSGMQGIMMKSGRYD